MNLKLMRVDFFIDPLLLFEIDELTDWEHYFYPNTKLLKVGGDISHKYGLCGSLGLWLKPAEEDIDSGEDQRLKGEEDWWAFLEFLTVPDIKTTHWSNEIDSSDKIIMYFTPLNFFSRPSEVVKIIDLNEFGHEGFSFIGNMQSNEYLTEEELEKEWYEIFKVFEQSIGAKKIE